MSEPKKPDMSFESVSVILRVLSVIPGPMLTDGTVTVWGDGIHDLDPDECLDIARGMAKLLDHRPSLAEFRAAVNASTSRRAQIAENEQRALNPVRFEGPTDHGRRMIDEIRHKIGVSKPGTE